MKRPKARDFQRTAVYRWEQEVVRPCYPQGIPREAVTLLCERVSVELSLPRSITWVENTRASRWAWGGDEITLPHHERGAWAYSVPAVLHECTHVALRQLRQCDMHGPRFVGLFLLLMKTCGGRRAKEGISDWATAAIHSGIQVTSMKHLMAHNVPAVASRSSASTADNSSNPYDDILARRAKEDK